jgi:peptide subunit release factor RF-3
MSAMTDWMEVENQQGAEATTSGETFLASSSMITGGTTSAIFWIDE